MRRANGFGFTPKPIATERTYANDVEPNLGHSQHTMTHTTRWQSPSLPHGRTLFAILSLFLLAGCSSTQHPGLGKWEGPQLLSNSSLEPWSFRGETARRIKSDHYVIYTTINDDDTLLL